MVKESNFKFVKGATFGVDARRGQLLSNESIHSFEALVKELNVNTITLPITAWQETAQSVKIDFSSEDTPNDFEIENFIDFLHQNSVRVILMPVVKLRNGCSRSFIDFYDNNTPKEPHWEDWFASYRAFILHMAHIACETGCSIFSVGCGLTKAQSREEEWKNLITDVKNFYDGFITYCAEVYSENEITFLKELDIISTTGCYPPSEINKEFSRIDKLCKAFDKPLLVLGCGCESHIFASEQNNNYSGETDFNEQEQSYYFRTLFSETKKRAMFNGFCVYEWPINLYKRFNAKKDKGYCVYGKEAANIIFNHHQ